MGTKRFKIYEKHVALSVSLKLGKYIAEAFPDVNIIYTRDSDVFLELNSARACVARTLRSLTRRVDSLMIMKTASRRQRVALTPSTQLEVQ